MTATTQDVRLAPRYTPAEAARLAGASPRSAREWFGERAEDERLSFLDLVEFAVARSFRASGANCTWSWVRALHGHLAAEWGETRPFATARLNVDGPGAVHAFEQLHPHHGPPLAAKATTGWELAPHVRALLADLDFDRDGLAQRWYPHGREAPVAIDPANYGGQPTVPDRRIPIATLQWRYFDGGETLDHLAQDFDLAPEIVEGVVHLPRYAD